VRAAERRLAERDAVIAEEMGSRIGASLAAEGLSLADPAWKFAPDPEGFSLADPAWKFAPDPDGARVLADQHGGRVSHWRAALAAVAADPALQHEVPSLLLSTWWRQERLGNGIAGLLDWESGSAQRVAAVTAAERVRQRVDVLRRAVEDLEHAERLLAIDPNVGRVQRLEHELGRMGSELEALRLAWNGHLKAELVEACACPFEDTCLRDDAGCVCRRPRPVQACCGVTP